MSCPLCGNERNDLFGGHEQTFNGSLILVVYVKCPKCGLIFQKNKLRPDYYVADYRKYLKDGSLEVREETLGKEAIHAETTMAFLKARGASPKRCLDVGSSAGLLLKEIERKYGCEVLGIEMNDNFREYSAKRGTPTVANFSEAPGKYDLITCVHTLEHQTEPMKFLWEIVERASGFLFFEVPFFRPTLPHHICFDMETFEKMLNRAGIKTVYKEEGYPTPLRIWGAA